MGQSILLRLLLKVSLSLKADQIDKADREGHTVWLIIRAVLPSSFLSLMEAGVVRRLESEKSWLEGRPCSETIPFRL